MSRIRVAREVGYGAIVFADLSRERARDVEFDWDRLLSFEGDTGPYCQYAYARICGILRKARERGVDENLELFHKMRAGEFADGARTLKAKGSGRKPR